MVDVVSEVGVRPGEARLLPVLQRGTSTPPGDDSEDSIPTVDWSDARDGPRVAGREWDVFEVLLHLPDEDPRLWLLCVLQPHRHDEVLGPPVTTSPRCTGPGGGVPGGPYYPLLEPEVPVVWACTLDPVGDGKP